MGQAVNSESEYESESAWLFYTRGFSILTAALIILGRCGKQILMSERKISTRFANKSGAPSLIIENNQYAINTSNQDSLDKHSLREVLPSIKGNKSLHFQPASPKSRRQNKQENTENEIEKEDFGLR